MKSIHSPVVLVMEELPQGAERQLVGEELPKGMERRLVLRLLDYWRDIAGEREYPSFADVDPEQIPDMWPNCFVLDAAGHSRDPVFRTIGASLAALAGDSLIDCRVSEAPAMTLVTIAVGYVGEVIEKRAPISRGGEFIKPNGTRVLYRSILLPMSDDGATISGVLGAANCREIDAEQESD